jgi:hypothetical protein
MGKCVKLDENNKVIETVLSNPEYGCRDCEEFLGGEWILVENDNLVSMGDIYDFETNVFTPEKPFSSWIYDEVNRIWNPPVPEPDDSVHKNGRKIYNWNEDNQSWKLCAVCGS